ncbi:MAG: hypothetical protein ABSA72_10295 [Nitrososphaerales archaeon]|jgi:hypothetical protein
MRHSKGVSGFVASLILVSISLSLAFIVYEGVSRFTPPREDVFSNQLTVLGGTPSIVEAQVNASSEGTPQALEADDASSHSGILFFNGTGYGTTQLLCLPGSITFFSVYTPSSALLTATSNGMAWIQGQWTSSLTVGPGWHEVMFSDASSCQVSGPSGEEFSSPGPDVSSVPVIGSVPSSSFILYFPTDGLHHSLILVFEGGFDTLA